MSEIGISDFREIIAIVRGLKSSSYEVAQALYSGGIRAMEFTFDQSDPNGTDITAKAINTVLTRFGRDMIVGAGTVTSVEMVQLAYQSGAKFIVSPNTDAKVIEKTKELGMLSFPGAMTPSEIFDAYQYGADAVKVFPAGVLGPEYIKAVRAPLSNIPLLAVGGINSQNISSFIKAGCIGVGVGGNLVNKAWIKSGQFDRITEVAEALRTQIDMLKI